MSDAAKRGGRGGMAWLHRHPVACFLLLGLSFLLFGLGTINLALAIL
ncbi:hypothetical protein PWG14_02025 (plasmid) [Chromobacterium amazonense]|nr:hypothetical protein [Chromobacterium amazonense]MDE1711569.1 hypothetical protein [Chromobacterium amazonense]